MLEKKGILVAGDIMLDTYHFGKVKRISPEAPVPVFLETGKTMQVPGGAANVAVNLTAIGIKTEICSVVGCDKNGDMLLDLLKDKGVGTENVYRNSKSFTTNKLRYIGQNNQQLLRVDTEDIKEIGLRQIEEILRNVKKNIKAYGLILLSDYKKGFLSEEITQEFIQIGKVNQIPALIDVKDNNYIKYRNAFLLKPNRKELQELTGMAVETEQEIMKASCRLCQQTSCMYVLTTLGADGMLLVGADGTVKQAKSVAKEVYDVTGAGDTSLAYLAAGILSGKRVTDAMDLANYAAGIQVSKMGTSIVYPDEVGQAMEKAGIQGKLLNGYQIDRKRKGIPILIEKKAKGKKIIFTNGCFDILHAGHVSYLKQAKAMGDILVVGINSDASVKRLKGEKRPVNCLEDRIMLLSALECVDYIIPFEEDTPKNLIEVVEPDILVKGGDYRPDDIVGASYVKSYGGIVTTLPFIQGKSTTKIIERLFR